MIPKELRVPDVEYIKNLEDVKRFLRELTTGLQEQHRALHNDLQVQDAVNFLVNGVRWRITVSGDDLVVQRRDSGKWTTKWTFNKE